jgi:hypothetical protein
LGDDAEVQPLRVAGTQHPRGRPAGHGEVMDLIAAIDDVEQQPRAVANHQRARVTSKSLSVTGTTLVPPAATRCVVLVSSP